MGTPLNIICKYCDYRWTHEAHSQAELKAMVCLKCKDKNLTFKDRTDDTIDTYVGCPPFPVKPLYIDEETIRKLKEYFERKSFQSKNDTDETQVSESTDDYNPLHYY